MKIIVLLLGFFIISFAQQSVPLDLRISTTGDKQNPTIIKTHYLKGTTIKHGRQTKTAPNGTLIFEANYNRDAYDGNVKSYYPNGTPKEERFYVNGKKQGVQKNYHSNGKLLSEQNFEQGKEEGEGRKYYESGALKEILHYKNGMRTGIRQEYHKEGYLQYETMYEQGKKIWMKTYDKNQNLIEEKKCRWQACY
ncbi:toxin-antitoxin system YwqK family antitoxin [Helicobacter sp. MIT 05-5293]|uniref:toxin-antitoxin system YwqK family antitoxin n=1 Tax=Helicobacter sp. MIT 05-5293 TaxID=1548149 RepID=UPI00051CD7D7|nr:toxin-antitoxin system YwqK family antitoxin [Helicobacter sp. MIT 05-5293]TLD81597.1 toxin-antitoxin system YwqK family antitoxin [Helicobacter sp. MIT 05-5293]